MKPLKLFMAGFPANASRGKIESFARTLGQVLDISFQSNRADRAFVIYAHEQDAKKMLSRPLTFEGNDLTIQIAKKQEDCSRFIRRQARSPPPSRDSRHASPPMDLPPRLRDRLDFSSRNTGPAARPGLEADPSSRQEVRGGRDVDRDRDQRPQGRDRVDTRDRADNRDRVDTRDRVDNRDRGDARRTRNTPPSRDRVNPNGRVDRPSSRDRPDNRDRAPLRPQDRHAPREPVPSRQRDPVARDRPGSRDRPPRDRLDRREPGRHAERDYRDARPRGRDQRQDSRAGPRGERPRYERGRRSTGKDGRRPGREAQSGPAYPSQAPYDDQRMLAMLTAFRKSGVQAGIRAKA
eukprot:m.93213 g.93213  ORF g.93213 m.93213 type:complete len:350 (+) comp14978_c0_seq1:3-1052(+)